MKKKSRAVPKELKDKYDEITEALKEFCEEYLNEEYYELSCDLCASLLRKRPSPLTSGRANTWACSIIHALGFVNFLFDPSQTPHMTPGELYESFGISSSTGQTKSKVIRDSFKMTQLDPEWTLPSMMENNPFVWTILVDGIAMDVRRAPREIQEAAYEQGIIPYIPGKEQKESPKSNVIAFPGKNKSTSKKSEKERFWESEELITKAYDTDSSHRRIDFARQALELSENCSEAYIILAQEAARNIEEERDFYEKALAAARRVIGEKTFEEDEGFFWMIHETRPYMRAKWYLAEVLWFMNKRAEAIEHLKDMLRLNKNDNQGIRYILINWLLQEGEEEYLEKLFMEYEEDSSAAFVYSQALFYYKKGNKTEAKKKLKEALKANPYVPKYILGLKKPPKEAPEYIGFGDETEAQAYFIDGFETWKSVRGALEWFRANYR